jgi:hypothetical protein
MEGQVTGRAASVPVGGALKARDADSVDFHVSPDFTSGSFQSLASPVARMTTQHADAKPVSCKVLGQVSQVLTSGGNVGPVVLVDKQN